MVAWVAEETGPSQGDETRTIVIMFKAYSYGVGRAVYLPF